MAAGTASEAQGGSQVPAADQHQADAVPVSGTDPRLLLTFLGILLGGIIGILTRPSVFLVGQLPLTAVLTRGATLSGIDQLLVPVAQSSFNHVALYTIVGGVIGLVVALLYGSASAGRRGAVAETVRQAVQTLTAPPIVNEEVLNNDAVLGMVAAGLGDDVVIGKIRYSRYLFALSSTDLADLKRLGVSDRVISAMLEIQARRGAVRS
jgi:hypothetical protein